MNASRNKPEGKHEFMLQSKHQTWFNRKLKETWHGKLTSTLASLGGDPGWGSSGGESWPVLGPVTAPPDEAWMLMPLGWTASSQDPDDSFLVGVMSPEEEWEKSVCSSSFLTPDASESFDCVCGAVDEGVEVLPFSSCSSGVIPEDQTKLESAWKWVRITMACTTSDMDQLSCPPLVSLWIWLAVNCHGLWARILFISFKSRSFLGAKSKPCNHRLSPFEAINSDFSRFTR